MRAWLVGRENNFERQWQPHKWLPFSTDKVREQFVLRKFGTRCIQLDTSNHAIRFQLSS
jgi:hypothetical protein